ncbi:MAG: MarR family winged helix-turn-helix transcriptional regulator [Faecalibacillus sp.]
MQENHLDYGELKVFRDVYKDLESVYDEFPKICGLSGAEYWALSMIDEGFDTQYAICEHLSLSRQTVNSAFKQLKKRGFIELKALDDNLRVKRVYLTDLGKEFVKEEISHMHFLEEKVWNAMEEEEQKKLTEYLYKYKLLLSEALNHYKKILNSSSEDL